MRNEIGTEFKSLTEDVNSKLPLIEVSDKDVKSWEKNVKLAVKEVEKLLKGAGIKIKKGKTDKSITYELPKETEWEHKFKGEVVDVLDFTSESSVETFLGNVTWKKGLEQMITPIGDGKYFDISIRTMFDA